MIFSNNTVKDATRLSLARWYNKVDDLGFKSFNVMAAALYEHYDEVLTKIYGDYMQLPPKEERRPSHESTGIQIYG